MSRQKSYIKAIRSLARSEVRDQQSQAVIKELTGDSDRSVMIVMVSFVEDILEALIKDHMRALNSDETNELFGPDRPIGSFSSKIRISYAFKIIDQDARKDLDLIREVRNAAAHSKTPLTFDAPEVLNVLRNTSLGAPMKSVTDAQVARFAFLALCQGIVERFKGLDSDPYDHEPLRHLLGLGA